jgi:hypothetical protein
MDTEHLDKILAAASESPTPQPEKCLHKTGGGGISTDANGVTTHTQFCDQCGWRMESKTPPVASSPSSPKEIEKMLEDYRQYCESRGYLKPYEAILSSWTALERERDRWEREAHDFAADVIKLSDESAEFRARCSVLEADAKAYRWMVENEVSIHPSKINKGRWVAFSGAVDVSEPSYVAALKKLDAAMGDVTK